MHLIVKTLVNQSYEKVFVGFDKNLFLKLAPPFPPVKLLRFDGCKTQDLVILELNFIFFKQTWESLIRENKILENEIYFIDEGIKLPFFLKSWQHRHRIIQQGEKTLIVDDIQFKTPYLLSNYLLYPLLWLQFAYRIPIYKRIFR